MEGKMRKLLISLAVGAATLGIAAPASAQWYPQPYGGAPYGYANPAAGQEMLARVAAIRGRAHELGYRHVLSWGQVHRLDLEADAINRQVWRHPYMSFGTRADLDARIARFQQWVDATAAQNMYSPRFGYGW
jgi:hypothetical protein